jgi:hypothetical protein
MGLSKDALGDEDAYVYHDKADVLFRYEGTTGKFFRFFLNRPDTETEVDSDDGVLVEALRDGEALTEDEYESYKETNF